MLRLGTLRRLLPSTTEIKNSLDGNITEATAEYEAAAARNDGPAERCFP